MKTVSMEQVKQAGLLLKREHESRLEFEKRANSLELEKRAMKIAFREVELGASEPYKTYEELMSKVASLLDDDLDVVEKALERYGSTSRRSGELDAGGTTPQMDPLRRFVLTGELE